MHKILGIDEAGRGPAIGPMVVAGFMIKEGKLAQLKNLELKSSKLHTAAQRANLAEPILGLAEECEIKTIQPPEIDTANLNTLSARASADLIALLRPHRAILDAPARGRGIKKYRNTIRDLSRTHCKINAFNKADEIEPVVSAASIIAKYYRDAAVKALQQTYGDFGSGYAHDPKTKKFLKTYYQKYQNFPSELVRHKWSTIQKIKKG